MDAWWTAQQSGLIGGLGGGILGTLGGLLGALIGCLAPRGKAKAFVLSAHGGLLAVGIVSAGLGIAAVSLGQPYHVYYPLLLIGVILMVVMGPLLPVVLLRYRQADARRLEAEEIRRG